MLPAFGPGDRIGTGWLIEALRTTAAPTAAPGLLRGLADERLAATLRRMHDEPTRPWTVRELAGEGRRCRAPPSSIGSAARSAFPHWNTYLAGGWLSPRIYYAVAVSAWARVAQRVSYSSTSTFSVASRARSEHLRPCMPAGMRASAEVARLPRLPRSKMRPSRAKKTPAAGERGLLQRKIRARWLITPNALRRLARPSNGEFAPSVRGLVSCIAVMYSTNMQSENRYLALGYVLAFDDARVLPLNGQLSTQALASLSSTIFVNVCRRSIAGGILFGKCQRGNTAHAA